MSPIVASTGSVFVILNGPSNWIFTIIFILCLLISITDFLGRGFIPNE